MTAPPDDGNADGRSHRGISRRAFIGWAGVLGAGAIMGGGARIWTDTRPRINISLPLYSETVAFERLGSRVLVPSGASASVIPGTRVLASAPDRDTLVTAERMWLEKSDHLVRVDDEWSDLMRDALLDIRVLLYKGVSVAAWSPNWRYVWPRDAAHVVAALALAGHTADAERCLRWLERVQEPRGWFEARYDPETRATPDGRPRQLDGHGWVLWALDRLDRAYREVGDTASASRLSGILETSLAGIESEVDLNTGLPPASPDYWERKESRLTLGTAAPLLVGLRSAERLAARAGNIEVERRAARTGALLEGGINESFAPRRFQRYAQGGGHCTSLAFLMPPYLDSKMEGLEDAFDEARISMARPAGGIAPGAGWKEDGISWTPETAIFANCAIATGRREVAGDYLRWLTAHRTEVGSLPEKVRADGRPAAVAPLAWSAAVVIDGITRQRELYPSS